MDYAVVSFRDEDQVSEVPVSWLLDDDKCWWPSAKNVYSYIKQNAKPVEDDPKWKLCTVQIECFSETLDEARKLAEYIEKSNKSSNKDEGSFKISLEPPKKKAKKNSAMQAAAEEYASSSQILTEASESEYISIPNLGEQLSVGQVISIADSTTTTKQIADLKKYIDNKINIVLSAISTLSESVNHLNRRLNNFEIPILETDLTFPDISEITNHLPMANLDDITSVESLLNSENIPAVRKYLLTVGGTNSKELTVRILKKVFKNELAMQCSWLGLRGNQKICNLMLTAIIKAAVQMKFYTDEKDFESVVSEWFRQSKQRYTRETMKGSQSKVVHYSTEQLEILNNVMQ